MATRLLQTIATGVVAAGETVALTHDLNILDRAVVPDFVWRDNSNFEIVSTTSTTVTVKNNNVVDDSCNIFVERKHSFDRARDSGILSPSPFVPAVGGAGSSSGATPSTTIRYTPDPGIPVHIETRYLRPGGSNTNDGLTPATAWADGWTGFKKAIDWFQTTSYNLCQRLNITGCTIALAEELQLGGGNLGGGTLELDFSALGPDNVVTWSTYQILASPVLDQALTVTLTAQDTNSKLWTVTVAETMVVNTHEGKNLLCDPGFQWGSIKSNTANQLLVATSTDPATWIGQVGAYSRSASLTFGSTTAFSGSAIYLQTYSPWTFVGIDFKVTPGFTGNSVNATCCAPTFFQMCSLEGVQLLGGAQEAYFDACDIHDGSTITVDAGGCMVLRESTVRDTTPIMHGTDHSMFSWVWFDNLSQPLGSGSLSISQFSFDVFDCQFDNCPAGALIFLTGNCRLQNAKIENSVGPIVVSNPSTRLQIINVGGSTGNTGVACTITDGAQVDVGATVTVSAAGGERKVGDNAVGNWVTIPETDVAAAAPHFCRVY